MANSSQGLNNLAFPSPKYNESAMELAKKVCYKERRNFCISTREDPMFPDQFRYDNGEQGYIVTSKMGLDDWYYVARVVGIQNKRCKKWTTYQK